MLEQSELNRGYISAIAMQGGCKFAYHKISRVPATSLATEVEMYVCPYFHDRADVTLMSFAIPLAQKQLVEATHWKHANVHVGTTISTVTI